MPTARLYDESSYGITLYNGSPDKKITMTSYPYDWLEASFFYTNIKNKLYCGVLDDPVCSQSYKDKGFNFKLRIKEEDLFPAIAIGINDIAGTGFYSSEYIVGSYGIKNLDIHFGLAWGALNGSKNQFKNPLGALSDQFYDRPNFFEDSGGQFQPSRYFSDNEVSPFYGFSYALNKNLLFKLEEDTTLTPGLVGYEKAKKNYSYGFDYTMGNNFTFGLSNERGNYFSFRFIYKNNPSESRKPYKYKRSDDINESDDKYQKLRKNFINNGIGVNKIVETQNFIGLELTQFTHPNLDIIEEIVASAKLDAGISKEIKTDLRIANLQAKSDFNDELKNNSKLVYERNKSRNFYTNNRIVFRPYIASRDKFFTGALLYENNSEYIIKDNFFLSSNIKYSLADNFDVLTLPPKEVYPAQVRSDVKSYLRNFNHGIVIGRAQLDYHITPKKNHHLMVSAGILEEMFSGIGAEYLYFKHNSNFAIGIEVFEVIKRDYKLKFGTLDYKNLTYSLNYYYRNYESIPFDMKISYGEYLAGDKGVTFELSRSFMNGTKFGVFASFTDVSTEDFGEGSFDKGIFFNIPVYGNFINYTWRPLTKDPGAKLVRKHTLYDLLVKFKPHN
jgi:hypothetical protein